MIIILGGLINYLTTYIEIGGILRECGYGAATPPYSLNIYKSLNFQKNNNHSARLLHDDNFLRTLLTRIDM